MRVRHLIGALKRLRSDTGWSTSDLPPRHAPIYSRTRPIRAGWTWRSGVCEADGQHFILTALGNPGRDNWQAILILETTLGPSVVARFEHHGSHPGLHGHAHCERGGVETGASGLDHLARVPKVDRPHRRENAWTEQAFWEAARRFFRVADDHGPQPRLL
jgi:hypothetical protein